MPNPDFAIVVGVTRYPSLGDLDGPEADAMDFVAWLQATDGGDVPAHQIEVIVSSQFAGPHAVYPPEPTTGRIEAAFDKLFMLGEPTGRVGRRLYIYMAGHGFAPNMVFGPNLDDAALLAANASQGMTGYHIPGRLYADWFRVAAYFDEVILLMDCCREHRSRAPLRGPPYTSLVAAQPAEICYALACEWARGAREGPYGPMGEIRGLFTMALLEGLRGGVRANANGEITASSLEAYIYSYIDTRSPGDKPQEPKFFFNRKHDFVFTRRGTPHGASTPSNGYHVVVTLAPPYSTRIVRLRDGAFRELPVRQQVGDLWEWEAPAIGLYLVDVEHGPQQVVTISGEAPKIHVQVA